MIRYVVMLRRRADVPRDEFLTAWLGEHFERAQALPGAMNATFMPSVDADSAFDGVGFIDFATREAMDDALATVEARDLRAHTATFSDSEGAARCVVILE